MKIAIASDHGGFELKQRLIEYLSKNHEIVDLGTDSLLSVDYPYYGFLLGKTIMNGGFDFGIGLCGTGIGISIAANKVKGIRAALVYSKRTAALAKEHNNANIICMGGRTTTPSQAIIRVEEFMKASFSVQPRHSKRTKELDSYNC